MRSLNKEKIRKNYEVKKFELSKVHKHELNDLKIDLFRRNITPGIKH